MRGAMPEPKPADLLLALEGATWRVVTVKTLAPSGLVLLFELQG